MVFFMDERGGQEIGWLEAGALLVFEIGWLEVGALLVFEFFQLILKVLDEGLFFIELTVDFDEFPVVL